MGRMTTTIEGKVKCATNQNRLKCKSNYCLETAGHKQAFHSSHVKPGTENSVYRQSTSSFPLPQEVPWHTTQNRTPLPTRHFNHNPLPDSQPFNKLLWAKGLRRIPARRLHKKERRGRKSHKAKWILHSANICPDVYGDLCKAGSDGRVTAIAVLCWLRLGLSRGAVPEVRCVCEHMCVCVCVWEKERDRQRERVRERQRVCVCNEERLTEWKSEREEKVKSAWGEQ